MNYIKKVILNPFLLILIAITAIGGLLYYILTDAKYLGLRDTTSYINLHPSLLVDTTNSLTIKDITDKELNTQFQSITEKNIILVNPSASYWLKFKIPKTSQPIALEVFEWIETAELFTQQEDGSFKSKITGLNLNFKDRAIQSNRLLIPINDHTKEKICYLKVKSKVPSPLVISSYTYKRLLNDAFYNFNIQGFFLGFLVLVGIYNFILYFFIKESTYLFYSGYVFSFAYFALARWNYIYIFFPLKFDFLQLTIPYSLMIVFLILYTRNFLQTKINFPSYDKILKFALVSKILIVVLGYILNEKDLYSALIDNFILLTCFVPGILSLRAGNKSALYFNFGFSATFIGLLNHALYSNWWLYLAGAVDVIFFSLALAHKYKTIKSEKEQAQERIINQLKENEKLKDKVKQELEEKVKQRTREIELQSKQIQLQAIEIERINNLLKADNIKLESDVRGLSQARVMQQEVTYDEFKKIYPDEESCYKYLSDLKWENGYSCRKCGYEKYFSAPRFSRRCAKCKYLESAPHGTVFSQLKFSILKAFYILFLVSSRKDITADELFEKVELRRETCWSFKKKILEKIPEERKYKKQKVTWSSLIQ